MTIPRDSCLGDDGSVDVIEPQHLHGTWRLLSAVAIDQHGTELPAPYGPIPMGRLVLTEAGRMMAVICDGRVSLPEGQKRGYASYCGNYVVDGDELVTTVDAALVPERIGSKQRRRLSLCGGRLTLKPPPRANGEQRELIWERDGPA